MSPPSHSDFSPKIGCIRVAIPAPIDRLFDYLPPESEALTPQSGQRVKVPFGRQFKIGVVVDQHKNSRLKTEQLKPIAQILDEQPLFSERDQALLQWVSRYYHHPLGQVYSTALPVSLRQGEAATIEQTIRWQLTPLGRNEAESQIRANAHRMRLLWQKLYERTEGCGVDDLVDLDWNWRPPLKTFLDRGWVETVEQAEVLPPVQPAAFQPNPDQRAAIDAIQSKSNAFHVTLLQGVTGSGKTEVYLQLIESILARGQQALVLLPEISLTPQLAQRFQDRLHTTLGILHSGLTDRERKQAWLRARAGQTRVLLGTRSAVFTPLPELGLIVLDEEHDASFKQQDGLHYSARDVALMRAKLLDIPAVLGSATPALESLHNAWQGRYQYAELPQRAGDARPPQMQLIDCRQQSMSDGLSQPLLQAMQTTLDASGQVLLFLNQRGYAPTLMCHACGWVAQCQRCDARLVIHAQQNQLRCHHCGAQQAIPERCGDCHQAELFALGQGTQRIEAALKSHFRQTPIVRIDRDSVRRKGALQNALSTIHAGQPCILIGTQMLAKGHHFPNVTLVGLLNVDAGLFSFDFRASERMAQMVLQVSGRAGRAERPGKVLLQTHHPDHPLLQTLLKEGYSTFARQTLAERQLANWPPFSHQALFRAESVDQSAAMDCLQDLNREISRLAPADIQIMGPVPAPMLKRAGRFRYQLLVQCEQRKPLHQLLDQACETLAKQPSTKRVRWSLDIDPVELL